MLSTPEKNVLNILVSPPADVLLFPDTDKKKLGTAPSYQRLDRVNTLLLWMRIGHYTRTYNTCIRVLAIMTFFSTQPYIRCQKYNVKNPDKSSISTSAT